MENTISIAMISRFLMCLVVLILFTTCGDSPTTVTKEKVIGKYAGKLPSGRIELWVFEQGGGFVQRMFRDDSDYLAGHPEQVFESSWSIKEGRLWVKQIVETFEWFPPFKMTKPTKVTLASPLLWMPEGYGLSVPIIEVLDDYGIMYVKVEKTTDTVRVFGKQMNPRAN